MNREDVKKILGEGATEEQISAVLDKFHTEQNDFKIKIANLESTVNSDKDAIEKLKGYKTQLEEIKRASLTEKEQLELEKKAVAEEKEQYKILNNSAKAKQILAGTGLEVEKIDELVASIVKEDEAATLASATLLATQLNTLKENTEKKTREELANINIKPNPTNIPPNSDKMTWDSFMKLSPAEQEKFRNEHPAEFEKL